MKNCPVCKLDYADDFSFCEFDGAVLEKGIEENPRSTFFSRLNLQTRTVQLIAFGLAVGLISLFIFATAIPKRKFTPPNQSEIAAAQPSPYFQTPQAAQDYVEAGSITSANTPDAGQEKPGVTVTIPEARAGKNSQASEPAKSTEEKAPTDRAGSTPQRTGRSATQPVEPDQHAGTENRPSARPQVAVNRQREYDDLAALAPPSSVNLSLVRIRSFRTDSGIRYDLTLNLQQQDGRVIRWDRLNLATHSHSGITHTEVVPFSQRLGSSGSLSFTVSVEMRGRSESDWQGRITCTGVGTDVDGRYVRTNLSARVTP